MKLTFAKVIFKVWCENSDWFVNKGKELGLSITTARKTFENMRLGNNIVSCYGPKNKVNTLCDWIKENHYDVDIDFYKEYCKES